MQGHRDNRGHRRTSGSRGLVAIGVVLAAILLWGVSNWFRHTVPSAAKSSRTKPSESPDRQQIEAVDSVAARQQLQQIIDFVPDWRVDSSYVGSNACRQCHPQEFESYRKTSHSQSLASIDPDHEPANAVFDHAPSGRRYRVTRREGRLVHEESLLLSDQSEFSLTTAPLKYRVGSGHFARTYLCDFGGGFLFESPVTWYESAQSWSMTPGYDRPGHRSFSRPVLENCLWCHSGNTGVSTTSHFRLQPIEEAIGCERCHGPGQDHVAFRNESSRGPDTRDPIVNPRRLSRKLSEAVCEQCHLQGEIHVGGRNVRDADFRPGQVLEQFGTVYRLRKSGTDMTVVGHVEQLHESPCYRQSETLTCMTCHDPHKPVAPEMKVSQNRANCVQCHQDQSCKLEISLRETRANNDCVHCHMPKSATEVPHLAFTHHRIGIHPLAKPATAVADQDLLVPISDLSQLSDSDRERSLMLAKLQMFLKRGAEFQRSDSGRKLSGQIEVWLQSLPQDVDVESAFARTQFLFSRGDMAGAKRTAEQTLVAARIRSEEAAALLDQLGQLDFQQNHLTDASHRFRELVKLRCQGQDWFRLGLTEERRTDLLSAKLALERALELEPANGGIYDALSRISQLRGDFGDAQRRREEGVRLRDRRNLDSR